MNLKKKILAITIGPVLILGIITILFTVTMVKNSMMDETKDALKGTAAATLAAYDQNTGDYLETSNGDIWKGSYNISKSENLVDRIKDNTGMDVTFFYGDKRIMTSAMDENGNRILKSKAGDVIVEKVLNGGEEYFSEAVSIEGTLNYGYFMPVYQNGSDTDIVGMVFVGTNKQDKDAVVMRLLGSIVAAVVAIMLVCLLVSTKLASTISRNIRTSIKTVEKIAAGDLNVQVNNKLLKSKDEIGDLSRVTITLRDAMQRTTLEINQNVQKLLEASSLLGTAADNNTVLFCCELKDQLFLSLVNSIMGTEITCRVIQNVVQKSGAAAQIFTLTINILLGISASGSSLFCKIPIVIWDTKPF